MEAIRLVASIDHEALPERRRYRPAAEHLADVVEIERRTVPTVVRFVREFTATAWV
jgi:hypothetical protein